MIVAPVAVATLAIRDALEANAPRGLNGKNENPLAELLGKADIGWNVGRGPFSVTGTANGLNISTTLNGSLRVTGQLATPGRQPHRCARRPARQQARRRSAEADDARARPARRHPRQRGGDVAAGAAADLADRAQSLRPGLARRRRHAGRRHQAQRLQRSEAAARQDRQRADRQPVQQASRRPHAGKRGAQAVDADVPLDLARPGRQPARRTCGSRSSRPAPSRRSRKSSPTG